MHLETFGNDSLERIRIIGLQQFTPSALQFLNMDSTVQNDLQLIDVYGFRKEIEGAKADGFYPVLFLILPGDDKNLDMRIHLQHIG